MIVNTIPRDPIYKLPLYIQPAIAYMMSVMALKAMELACVCVCVCVCVARTGFVGILMCFYKIDRTRKNVRTN